MLALTLLACLVSSPFDTAERSTDTAPPARCAEVTETGTLGLTFRIDPALLPSMGEPASGTFYGAFYDAQDVSNAGPAAGAPQLGTVTVEGVDLGSAGGPTGTLAATDPLPACEVVLLGFLDTDRTAFDPGDPLTLPEDARASVPSGMQGAHEVYFRLLNPSR